MTETFPIRSGASARRGAYTRRRALRGLLFLALAVGLAAVCAALALAAGRTDAAVAPVTLETGKKLYRKYCGQCHALKAARAAGFGSNAKLGKEGGPNFNNLRVPFSLSVMLMTQASSGHERIYHKLSWKQIREVATFVAEATKKNTLLAQPTDG